MSEVIRVQRLFKDYPVPGEKAVLHAVSDVSFTVARGKTLGLVGESGSGKTTVGKCILRLEELTDGEVFFDGEPIGHIPLTEMTPLRSRMQMVFQEPYSSLNPRLSVRTAVEEPLKLLTNMSSDERRERILEMLDVLALKPQVLDLYPHELTGGQAQKACIARALVTHPKFVVHDEPTSFLDTTSRAEILTRLARLQEEMDLAYLYISHDLTTVRDMADRVAVMYLSQVVEMGTKKTIFEHHVHPYTRALLSSVLFPDPTLERSSYKLEGEIPSPIDLPSGCYLYQRCPMAQPECADTPQRLVDVGGGHLVRCQVVTSEYGETESTLAPDVESAVAA
jgi:oligopeptide/dipeptide ABC transporter ATP-binding protein